MASVLLYLSSSSLERQAHRNWRISRKTGKLPEMKLIETCTLHLLAPTVPRNPWCLPSLHLHPHSRVGFCVYPKALLSQCPVDLKDVVNPQATSAQDFWSFTLTDKSNLGFYEDIPTHLAGDFFGAADCFLVIVWKKAKQDAYNRELSSVKFGKRLFTNEIALLALLSSTNWCIAIVCNSDIVLCRQVLLQK